MLCGRPGDDEARQGYEAAVAEIIRGVQAVSGLTAAAAEPGWVAVTCESMTMARWLAEAIERENVQARWEAHYLLLPVGADYHIEDEIKSVITVVAKTTDYWYMHLPPEVKQALVMQDQLERLKARVTGWWHRFSITKS